MGIFKNDLFAELTRGTAQAMSGELPAALCHQCNFYGSLAQLPPPTSLGNVYIANWKITIFNGTINYFYGHFQ